jgi:hypothetical protein
MLDAYCEADAEELIKALKQDIQNSYSSLRPQISAQN